MNKMRGANWRKKKRPLKKDFPSLFFSLNYIKMPVDSQIIGSHVTSFFSFFFCSHLFSKEWKIDKSKWKAVYNTDEVAEYKL